MTLQAAIRDSVLFLLTIPLSYLAGFSLKIDLIEILNWYFHFKITATVPAKFEFHRLVSGQSYYQFALKHFKE